MSILSVVLYNDPVLREKAAAIKENDKKLQKLIDDMYHTMYEASGVGLAAPQIGKSLRLFVIDADIMVEDDEDDDLGNKIKYGPMEFINPEIVGTSSDLLEIEEGCLSLPDLREKVTRPDEITVKFLDREFKEHEMTLNGWMSRVFQHELDHLNGVLFIDYLGSFKKRLLTRRLGAIDAGEVETDYEVKAREESHEL